MSYDWEKLNQIFHQALERAPQERAAFIRESCAEDASLRDEALALLRAHEEDADFMETPLMGANLAGQFGDWQGRIVARLQAPEAGAQGSLQARPPDYLIGQVLDAKYRIEERRGQGGMGAVYRALHQGTGRLVAIKIIAPEFMANPEFVERFRREAKAAGMLNHPHVVNVTDFGITTPSQGAASSVAYLVMEYLEGLTLADLLKEKKSLPLESVVSILEQICRAVDEAHRVGILHRDLKPENIWLEPLKHGGYHVKVLDFGLAKLRERTPAGTGRAASPPQPASAVSNRTRILTEDEAHTLRRVFSAPSPATAPPARETERTFPEADAADERALTRPTMGQLDTRTSPHWFSRVGLVLGTPTYMSPEQCRGERLDTASDIYSLGVVAYQMLAGEAPFAGTTADLLSQHKEMTPPPLGEKRAGLPLAVAEVLASALSKERAGRPATAGAFAAALRLGAEGESAIRKEALALYQKHRWLFLKTAARVHAPVISIALLLLIGAICLPLMPVAVALVVFSLLWLAMLWLSLYGNAATTAACTLIVTQLPQEAQSSGASKAIAATVRRESAHLAGAAAIGLKDALSALLHLRRAGWRAYFDSLLLLPLVATEKLRGREALDRAQKLGAHVRRQAVDIRALHLATVLFSLLMYQVVLVACGVLVGAVTGETPRPASINNLVVILPMLALLVSLLILLPVRSAIEHAVLYLKAREIDGERVRDVQAEIPASVAALKLERRRVAHARAIALGGLVFFSISGWLLLKQELMAASVEDGSVSLVKAFNASGVSVPLWPSAGHPDMGEVIRYPAMIEFLIEKGANVNARVVLGRGWNPPYKADMTSTPLMCALSFDLVDSARVLLEHGADVRARDSNGRNPLMVAAINSPGAIDLLLGYGADINEGTEKGTALNSAARYRGLYESNVITEADLSAQENVVARLLKKGAQVDARDEEGRTALMLISMEYRPDRIILPMAEALLNGGADLSARDRNGRTPLMYAVRHKQRATLEFLLRHGADAGAKDNAGATALDLAQQLGFDTIARTLSTVENGSFR
jgi:serine/threonine protein kinase/ankyrin repeat protein